MKIIVNLYISATVTVVPSLSGYYLVEKLFSRVKNEEKNLWEDITMVTRITITTLRAMGVT